MRKAVFVTGLAIGEETKGAAVEWLSKLLSAHTVIRTGGFHAGHYVVLADGREHGFSHFGCGTFNDARTHLIDMVISPVDLFNESIELGDQGITNPLEMITIDRSCLTATPFHWTMSRLREILRGDNKKGTIGRGVGEVIRDSQDPQLAIRAGDFKDGDRLLSTLERIRQTKLLQAEVLIRSYEGSVPEEAFAELHHLEDESLVPMIAESFSLLSDLVRVVGDDYLDMILAREGSIVCEPSHGVLLHPWYGFVPHVTQCDPLAEGFLRRLQERYSGEVIRLGVLRSYMTRQSFGPLVSYSPELTQSVKEIHNDGNPWLGKFRNGHFDVVALDYSLRVSGQGRFDGLIVSYLDLLERAASWEVCEAYEFEGDARGDLDAYFVLDGAKIIGIKVYPDTRDDDHRNHQVRLTELLKQCRPVLRILRPGNGKSLEQVFLSYVEERLGVPIVAVANGSTAEHRRVMPGWEHLF